MGPHSKGLERRNRIGLANPIPFYGFKMHFTLIRGESAPAY